MKDSELLERLLELTLAIDVAGAPDVARRINQEYLDCREAGATVVESMLEALQVATPDGYDVEPVNVPIRCALMRDSVLKDLEDAQRLRDQVAAAQRTAGWPPALH